MAAACAGAAAAWVAWVALCAVAAVAASVAALAVVCRRRPARDARGRRSVTVLVLGDFGRSPRMQYHALSLGALPQTAVDVVAYGGTDPVEGIASNPETFRLHLMRPPPALPKSAPRAVFLMYAPFKVVYQVAQLLLTMTIAVSRPTHILVQNPPSIPSLPVAVFVAALHGARLVIDWHNYGYTILAMGLGEAHPVVRLAAVIEAVFGRLGTDHICVTHAMRRDLAADWGVQASVLHDRPPPFFRPTPSSERHELFSRLAAARAPFDVDESDDADGGGADGTLFTDSTGAMRPDRPALLVSSTSWTPDEDFGILLDALRGYEAAREREESRRRPPSSRLPRLVCVVTGKGPLKAHYEAKMAAMKLRHVRVATAWLEPGDYPRLLGAADLGVSLHTSSSGLDLPMKVVDMFGCSLPVCAKRFACLDELVKDGVNGCAFDTPAELGEQILSLLRGFPGDTARLDTFRDALAAFRNDGWSHNWAAHAAPVFAD